MLPTGRVEDALALFVFAEVSVADIFAAAGAERAHSLGDAVFSSGLTYGSLLLSLHTMATKLEEEEERIELFVNELDDAKADLEASDNAALKADNDHDREAKQLVADLYDSQEAHMHLKATHGKLQTKHLQLLNDHGLLEDDMQEARANEERATSAARERARAHVIQNEANAQLQQTLDRTRLLAAGAERDRHLLLQELAERTSALEKETQRRLHLELAVSCVQIAEAAGKHGLVVPNEDKRDQTSSGDEMRQQVHNTKNQGEPDRHGDAPVDNLRRSKRRRKTQTREK